MALKFTNHFKEFNYGRSDSEFKVDLIADYVPHPPSLPHMCLTRQPRPIIKNTVIL